MGVHISVPSVVSPWVDKPLKSVTHGQCDVRPTVTFPNAGHHRPLIGTKLHCFVTEARARKILLPENGMTGSRTQDFYESRVNAI